MLSFLIRKKHLFKPILFSLSVLIALSSVYIFNQFIHHLEDETRTSLEFQINVFKKLVQSENNSDISFFLEDVISRSSYPVIYTDNDTIPRYWKNVEVDSASRLQMALDIKTKLTEFQAYSDPIAVTYDSLVLGYYFYGYPDILDQLEWLPIIVLLVSFILVFAAYYGFKKIRSAENQVIWVGLSKETAHQLGTPVSSLSGWVEVIKEMGYKTEYLNEIDKDVSRLNTVLQRFSLIGSKPVLKNQDILLLLMDMKDYFQKRIPKLQKSIDIEFNGVESIPVKFNYDLLSWVLENLIKNAIDAIDKENGKIEIRMEVLDKYVQLFVRDTGKGLLNSDFKKIFETGFTTKTRGWGIGLSLSKRIIESFHKGKIKVHSSEIDKGTEFLVQLRKS